MKRESGGVNSSPNWARLIRLAPPRPSALCPELKLHLLPMGGDPWHDACTPFSQQLQFPYWAVAWPGGEALARYLLDAPHLARDRRVYELGCGGGIAAIAAARTGAATVTAVDTDPLAVRAVHANAALNGVSLSSCATDPLPQAPPNDVDLILAADLWYEAWIGRRVTPWLRAAAARGVTVLTADPGRRFAPRAGYCTLAHYRVPTSTQWERQAITPTRVMQLHAKVIGGNEPNAGGMRS